MNLPKSNAPKMTNLRRTGLSRNRLRVVGAVLASLWMTSGGLSETPSSTTATYGDWIVRCLSVEQADTETSIRQCEVVHEISIQQEGQPPRVLVQLALGFLPDANTQTDKGQLKMVASVPTGVDLRNNVRIAVDVTEGTEVSPEKLISASFFRCQQNTCLADTDMTDGMLDLLLNAETAQVSFTDSSLRNVIVPLSLSGFGAATSAAFDL